MTDEAPTAAEVAALIARIYNVDPYLKDAFPNAYIALSEAAAALAAQAQRIAVLEVERDGAITRGQIALMAKNGWADRARAAEAALRQAPPREPTPTKLEIELSTAINRCSAENASNTPDFILAQYLEAALLAFNAATQQRENWYGRDAAPIYARGTLDDELACKAADRISALTAEVEILELSRAAHKKSSEHFESEADRADARCEEVEDRYEATAARALEMEQRATKAEAALAERDKECDALRKAIGNALYSMSGYAPPEFNSASGILMNAIGKLDAAIREQAKGG